MRTLHTGLRVTDLARSLTFYTALGYEVVGDVAMPGSGSLTMLKLPDDPFVALELVHDPNRGAVEPGGLESLVVKVEVMTDTVAQLAAKGIKAEPPTFPNDTDDFWTAWLSDPDGYRIELVQWPTGHPAGMVAADFTGDGPTGG
jgi:lactoylglutathione lyase